MGRVIHIVRMEQSKARYWFASCSCGWKSQHDARLASAERMGLEHTRAHDERRET